MFFGTRGRARAVAAWICALARVAAADDDVEDVHVRGDAARGFESRATVDDSRVVTDAASLVEPLPGVHVRRLGADDGFATLSIRGSSSNEVAFYLAGVPLPLASNPTIDLSTLPLWPGSQARVYRTFTPAALGPGSLGGTLAIDAPAATGPDRTDLWMAGGSFGALRMRVADVRDLGGGVRVASALSANRSDGDFSYYNADHNAPILDPRAFIPRVNDDSAQASGLVSLVVPLHLGESRAGTMRATALLQESTQGLPGAVDELTPFARFRTDRELGTVEIAFPISRGALSAQLWGVREGSEFHDAPGSLDPTLARTSVITAGGGVAWRARFDALSIAAKLDARGERYEPGDYTGPTPGTGATREALGAGVDAELRASRKVTLAASARADVWNDASDDPTSPASLDARPSANVGVDATFGALSLAAHGGYTSRPANFVERFGSPGGFLGTPTLLPESAFTIDAGARLRKKIGGLRVDAELDGFAQYANDLITFAYVGFQHLPKAENIGTASLAGVEATLRARFFRVEIRASYTGLYTRDDDDTAQGASLPGRPAHDFVLDASYTFGPFRLRYALDALADMTLDGDIPIPPRVLQNIGVQLDVPRVRGVRISADIRNLFDVRTADYPQSQLNGASVPLPIGDLYAYPLPGRSFLVSLSWRFGAKITEEDSR
jgi:iron complex outermembrane receptor protein